MDRERGGTEHNQWHQQQGSVHVVSVNIHVFNLKDAYQKESAGWFKVHKPLMRHGLRLCQAIDDLQPAMYYKRQCLELGIE